MSGETPDLLAPLQASVDRARAGRSTAVPAVPDPPDPGAGAPEPVGDPGDVTAANLNAAVSTAARCRQYRDRERDIQRIADERIEQIQAWADDAINRIRPRREWWETWLKAYATQLRKAGGSKTLRLPGAVVATRNQAGGWKTTPEAIEWAAAARPDLLTWKPSFDLAQAKREFKAIDGEVVETKTGLVIPGITPDPDRTDITITYPEET